ncbi:MAG: universal stress protein [Xenococcus sp. MO_188.B8]|nr:universal stress protein [Xenococcus sp. MO_188.B8]
MKILLCTDGSLSSQVSYEYTAWLGSQMEVEIEILYVTDQRKVQAVKTRDFTGSIGLDSYQQLLDKLVEAEGESAKINHQRAKIILQEAKSFLEGQGIDKIKLTHVTGFLVDQFHKFEPNADLIILGKRGENANFAAGHLGANTERILRSSHKPSLVIPRAFKPINRILLAYDGGKSCQKAIQYLTNLSALKQFELHIITVTHRDDKTATKHLEEANNIAIDRGFNPICNLLHGDAEPEMEKYVTEHNIDFLIMGAYGHSRIRHLVIGSTTAQMLRGSQIPILLFR